MMIDKTIRQGGIHRVVTPCMQRTHSLHRPSICIDSVDTILALLFFDEIVSTSMPSLRVIADVIAAENVIAPMLFGDERRGARHLGRSPCEPG